MAIDFLLDSAGDLPVVTRMGSGVAVIEQRLELRLRRHLGEWFLNTTLGLPFIRWMESRPAPMAEIAALVRREISTCPGVLAVDSFESAIDTAGAVTITAAIRTEDGETTVGVSGIGARAVNNTYPMAPFVRVGAILP